MSKVTAPFGEEDRQRKVMVLLALLFTAVGVFLRVYNLSGVPPGVHYDEILNGEIAEQALREGFEIFYARSGGREGLYHIFLAGSLRTSLPVAWKLRLPSVLMGVVTMVFSALWVRRAFGKWAALTTLGLMAVSFWTVWASRVALRATTVPPVAAVAAYLLVRQLARKEGAWRGVTANSVALGVVVGLSFYTYRAGSMIYLTYVLFALYLLLWHRGRAKVMLWPLIAGLVVALPMLLLFVTRPEVDPRFGQVAVPWQALIDGDPRPVLQGLLDHLGMFFWRGDLESHYNLPGRPLFEPLGAVLFVAGACVALWRWRKPMYAFCLLWLGLGIAPGIFTIPAPSFVHTISAQGIVFVFPGIAIAALHEWLTCRKAPGAFGITAGAVALLVVINGAGTFVDYFQRWPRVADVRGFHQSDLALIAGDLDRMEGTAPVAVCSSVLNEDDSFWRSGRQSIRFMMEREDLAIRWYDCGLSQVIPASRDTRFYFPNESGLAEWLPEQPHDVAWSPLSRGSVRRAEVDATAWIQALDAEVTLPRRLQAPVQFGEELRFLGYRLAAERVEAGSEISLLTYWEVTAVMPVARSIFVHMMGEDGQLVAQGDALTLLSDTLLPGDQVMQLHRLTAPADTAAGDYPLSVGVYSRLGDQPPLTIENGEAAGEARLELTAIDVTRP